MATGSLFSSVTKKCFKFKTAFSTTMANAELFLETLREVCFWLTIDVKCQINWNHTRFAASVVALSIKVVDNSFKINEFRLLSTNLTIWKMFGSKCLNWTTQDIYTQVVPWQTQSMFSAASIHPSRKLAQ